MIVWMKYEKGRKLTTLTMESGEMWGIHHAIRYVLDQLCNDYGSTYEGRKQAIAKTLHISQKIPILLSEQRNDILFPICDMRNTMCYWLNYRYIKKVIADGKKCCTVCFDNGASVSFPVNYRVINMQLKRCNEYLAFLNQKYKENPLFSTMIPITDEKPFEILYNQSI